MTKFCQEAGLPYPSFPDNAYHLPLATLSLRSIGVQGG